MKQQDTKSFHAGSVKKKWFKVNAEGLRLGRLATQVAVVLQGKHKACYTPHTDLGDFVVVYNCDKLACTTQDKIYYRHSGRIGGLKQRTLDEQMLVDSTAVMTLAVKRMLKRSPLGRKMLTKLKCYSGDHNNQAQQPEDFPLNEKGCLSEEAYSE